MKASSVQLIKSLVMSQILMIQPHLSHLVYSAACGPRDRNFESLADLMSAPNEPSLASQKCREGDVTQFIECHASTRIPSKSILAASDERVCEDSSNADAALQSLNTSKPLRTMKRSN